MSEGRKDESDSSEIKLEMKLLRHLEELVRSARGIVAILVGLPGLWRPYFLPDSEIAGTGWFLVWLLAAGIVFYLPFWDKYLDVLRKARMRRFWDWRSARLRFPLTNVAPSTFSDASELPPEASTSENKPPYLLD